MNTSRMHIVREYVMELPAGLAVKWGKVNVAMSGLEHRITFPCNARTMVILLFGNGESKMNAIIKLIIFSSRENKTQISYSGTFEQLNLFILKAGGD